MELALTILQEEETMANLTALILLILFAAAPAAAAQNCGELRWVNGYAVCPPTAAERIQDQLRENQRVLREQQRSLEEISRQQRAAASQPQPQPQQVIYVTQPAPVQKVVEPPVAGLSGATPEMIYRTTAPNGTPKFSNVQ